MFDEVDEFIRRVRAAQQQQQQAAQGQRAPRPTPQRPAYEVVDAEIIEAEPVAESIPQRVKRAKRDQKAKTAQPGPVRAQRPVEALPDIESLSISQEEVDLHTAAGLRADDISQILRDPQSLRNAIVISEILNRPTHRWK